MNIRDHIRKSITDGLSAEFSQRDGRAGVIFHDENEFIPFDDLNYNNEYGYYRLSQFPNIARDCTNENPETLHLGKDFSENWKPIIWADSGGNLALIGDIWQAADLYQALKALVEDGTVDPEEISENDPAWDYMKRIDWAVKEYRDFFPDSPLGDDQIRNSVRAAAKAGRIHGCSQDDIGNWHFRPAAFRGWLVKTRDEKRGRPAARSTTWDDFLFVEGNIDHGKWCSITVFASKLPGFVLLGGWTGEQGRMSLKFRLYQASQNLDALWAYARDLGLNAFKPEPTF